MNPLNIWRNMAAKTRMTLIIVAGCVLITFIICAAWKAAYEINEHLNYVREEGYRLLVCGHSKAGATAIAYKKLFGADFCVAFAPARSLRYWSDRKIENTTLFIDPDDPVSKAGFVSFGHPKCEVIEAKGDHLGLCVGGHFMEGLA